MILSNVKKITSAIFILQSLDEIVTKHPKKRGHEKHAHRRRMNSSEPNPHAVGVRIGLRHARAVFTFL